MLCTASETRWRHLTPDRFLVGLSATVLLMMLADWISLGVMRSSGWNVLLALATLCLGVFASFLWFAVSVFRRRRFQFGMRTLLLLALAVTICCSWFTCRMQEAKRQKKVLEEIRQWGGGYAYDYHFDSLGNRILPPKWPGPAWLRNLVGEDFLADVVYVGFYGPGVTDAATRSLPKLTHLRWLRLHDTKISYKRYQELRETMANCEVSMTSGSGTP